MSFADIPVFILRVTVGIFFESCLHFPFGYLKFTPSSVMQLSLSLSTAFVSGIFQGSIPVSTSNSRQCNVPWQHIMADSTCMLTTSSFFPPHYHLSFIGDFVDCSSIQYEPQFLPVKLVLTKAMVFKPLTNKVTFCHCSHCLSPLPSHTEPF